MALNIFRWPWSDRGLETAAAPRDYGELIDQLIYYLALGRGDEADARLSGALEACARLYADALATAEVQASAPVQAAITPALLSQAGRDYIERGEFVAKIRIQDGLQLRPSTIAEAYGGPRNPEYLVREGGAETAVQTREREPDIIHAVFNADATRPYLGSPPWLRGAHAGRAVANLERVIGDESAMPAGATYPMANPATSNSEVMDEWADVIADYGDQLRGVMRNRPGGIVPMMTQKMPSWTQTGSPPDVIADRISRFGPTFAPATPLVYSELRATLMAACGIPAVLSSPNVQGAQLREAYRWWLAAAVQPRANVLAAELQRKLATPVALTFPGMTAADIASRTRALKQLVEAGFDRADAARIVGLESG